MINNPYLVIPLVTWLLVQTAKFVLRAFAGQLDFRLLYASGGMPSAHSAVVCALAAVALIHDGANGPIFGLTVVLAAIVMYDSFGVRRASGEQAAAINLVIDHLNRDRTKFDLPRQPLREILGHQPLEVTVGALTGLLTATLFNLDRLESQLKVLSSQPGSWEKLILGAIMGISVVGGLVARGVIKRRFKNSRAVKPFTKALTVATQVSGWLGLALVFAAYEQAAYLSWRVWPYLILAGGAIWLLALAAKYRAALPQALTAEREHRRKQRWLPGRAKNPR